MKKMRWTYRHTVKEMTLPKVWITRMWHWERWEISELICPPSRPILHRWKIKISIRGTNGSLNKISWASVNVQYLECTNVVLIPKHVLNHSPVPDKGVWFDQSKIWSIQHRNLEIFLLDVSQQKPQALNYKKKNVCSKAFPIIFFQRIKS